MSESSSGALPEAYGRALARVGATSLTALQTLEACLRRLHPPQIPALREQLTPVRERLETAVDDFDAASIPEGLAPFHEQLAAGARATLESTQRFLEPAPPEQQAAGILASMRAHSRAQELLYPLRVALPPLAQYFVEAAFHDRLGELDPEPPEGIAVGLHRAGTDAARGGFSLYVPEYYRGDRPWPMVVALHGGFGEGRDFLWTWLREARGRGFLLLAPTSRRTTWALDAPAGDSAALRSMIDYVGERWNVDRTRLLLTGLSDGATFTLLEGLAEGSPFTALAPVSGVLHPANHHLGNLERARERRIYLVHGALDWMFPVALARAASETLQAAGAELVYREIEDLSHTYPREENARILEWFDPELPRA